MKWACVGCGQGVDYHGNPITEDERQAWCYDCAEEIDRVAKSMGGARCRNCGNSGVSPWTGKPCGCPAGQALARLQADNGVEVVSEMADETRLRCGDRVRVIGPAATSPGDTFAIGKETTVAELRTDDEGHTVYACQIRGWGFVAFPRASLERIDETMTEDVFMAHMANMVKLSLKNWPDDWRTHHTFYDGEVARLLHYATEPRAIVRAFALAMECKLAANDAVKGGWTDVDWIDHYCALLAEIGELVAALSVLEDYRRHGIVEDEARLAVLDEAADCANYLMMICDVVGALPPTDERGR